MMYVLEGRNPVLSVDVNALAAGQPVESRRVAVTDVGTTRLSRDEGLLSELTRLFLAKEAKTDTAALNESAQTRLFEALKKHARPAWECAWEGAEPRPQIQDGTATMGVDAIEEDNGLAQDMRLASYLKERFKGAGGAEVATTTIDKATARWSKGDRPALWKTWFNLDDGQPQWIARLLFATWRDVVRPSLVTEEERARRKERPVRYSTELAKTFAQGSVYGGTPVGTAIMVRPPKGLALALPFSNSTKVVRKGGKSSQLVGVQQALPASSQRNYLATLVLFQDAGSRADGTFEIDGPDSVLDVTGATKHKETKSGRVYQRFATKDRAAVKHDLGTLFPSIRVLSVGDLEVTGGDPLIDEVHEKRTRRTTCYAHSRLIVGALRSNYIQIPRAVCRLDTRDVQAGIGIALMLRQHVLAYLRHGTLIEAPVGEWLDAAGVDATAGTRHDGASFWDAAIADLVRIADEAQIGKLKSDGQRSEAVLTLDPADGLKDGYAPLVDAMKAHTAAGRGLRGPQARRDGRR